MFELIEKIIAGKIKTKNVDAVAPEGFRGELHCQPTNCVSCMACQEACSVGAIIKDEKFGVPHIDYKKCIFCGNCVDACGQHALTHQAVDVSAMGKDDELLTLGRTITAKLGRSLHIRHLDAGSCNACDFEMGALSNPVYDLHRYGIAFVASPRHADLLMVTGVVTRNLEDALMRTYEAMPEPKMVMAVGACAAGGGVFEDSYAHLGPVHNLLPVDISVPGCPPRPAALLAALVAAADLYKEKSK